jgi:hypothetical protein
MKAIKVFFIVLLSFMVVACGGGGGGLNSSAPTSSMTLSPGSVDAQSGQPIVFNINGGQGPYSVTSSNNAVIPVPSTTVGYGEFTLSVANTAIDPSNVTVTVTDGQNKTASATVNVTPGKFTVTPGTLSLRSGSTQTFTIHGGTAPYSVYSDKPALVAPYPSLVSTSNRQFSVTPVNVSTSVTGITLTVYDAVGRSANVSMSIDPKVNPIQSVIVAPAISGTTTGTTGTVSIKAGQSGLVTALVAPEFVTSSRPLTMVDISGNFKFISNGVSSDTLSVNADALGVANAIISINAKSPSSFGIVRVIDNGTGSYMDTTFMIAGAALTTVPNTVTLTGNGTVCGGSSSSVFVFGGQAPYHVVSTDTAVATVSPATLADTGLAFTLTGGSKCSNSGTAVIVTDAALNSVQVLVMNVTDNGSGGTGTPLAVWPASATITGLGKTANFTITGGTAPYAVTSNQPGIITVAPSSVASSGGTFTATTVAVGTSSITITDATGAVVSANVTVSNAVGSPVVLSPNSGNVVVGDSISFVITGGTSPYTITSSSTSIATASPASVPASGGSVSVKGVTAGSTPIVVTDSNGTVASFSATVTAAPTGQPLVLSPAVASIAVGMNAVIEVSGGTPPYAVLSSSSGIASVSPSSVATSGGNFTVNGVSAGSITATITDATGAQTTGTYTITTSNPAVLTVTPTAQTITGGGKTVNFVITGGLAPYNLVSSQPSVATVPATSTGNFSATTVNSGVTTIVITDASGAVVNASLTVQ